MSSEAISLWTETSSDPELIAGVRAGDTSAFGVLYERHVDAAKKVATVYTNSAADVDDVVSEAFSRVLRALQRGDGPDLAFRAYLFTIVRRTGMDIINKGIRTKPREDMGEYESSLGFGPSSDEPALEGFEHGLVADAFKSLPERWQAVLWYTEVEKKSPREIAPLLGLSANGVAALSYRAREALRQAYLQQHLNTADTVDCLEVNSHLGSFVRGGLSKREHQQVDGHIRLCDKCAVLVTELEDVNRGMRGVIAPLVLGLAGVALLEGGLPIGGAFGPGAPGGSAAGAGASGAGGTGGAAGGTGTVAGATGTAGVTSTAGVGGVAGGSAAGTGVGVGAGAGGGLFGAMTSGSFGTVVSSALTVVLPAIALTAAAVLVFNIATVFNQGDTDQPAPDVVAGEEIVKDPAVPGGDPVTDDNAGEPVVPTEEPVGVNPGTTPEGSGNGTGSGTGTGDANPQTTTPPADPGPQTSTPPPASDPDPTPTGTPPASDPDPAPPVGTPFLAIQTKALEYLVISRSAPIVGMQLVNNGTASATGVVATIGLPSGLEFATPTGGGGGSTVLNNAALSAFIEFETTGTFTSDGWECSLNHTRTIATCELDELEANDVVELALDLEVVTSGKLAATAMTSFDVTYDSQTTSYSVLTSLQNNAPALAQTFVFDGPAAATQVGAPLLACDQSLSQCTSTLDFNGNAVQDRFTLGYWNRDGRTMAALNEAGGQRNSATTTLTSTQLPAGSTVVYASLTWSSVRGATDSFDGPLDVARLRVPGATTYVDITADQVTHSTGHGDTRFYYQSTVDITDLVEQHGVGAWSLADVALPASFNDTGAAYYGGFAITIVYSHPIVDNSRVAIFVGNQWVSPGTPFEFPFSLSTSADVTVGMVAWEGQRGLVVDQIQICDNVTSSSPCGTTLQPWAFNGAGDSGNAADSTARGSQWSNSFGVDAKDFRSQRFSARSYMLWAWTTNDPYLIGSLTVTVNYD